MKNLTLYDVYCNDKNEGNAVYRANEAKVIANIQGELKCSAEEAKNKLFSADINNPLVFNTWECWIEER